MKNDAATIQQNFINVILKVHDLKNRFTIEKFKSIAFQNFMTTTQQNVVKYKNERNTQQIQRNNFENYNENVLKNNNQLFTRNNEFEIQIKTLKISKNKLVNLSTEHFYDFRRIFTKSRHDLYFSDENEYRHFREFKRSTNRRNTNWNYFNDESRRFKIVSFIRTIYINDVIYEFHRSSKRNENHKNYCYKKRFQTLILFIIMWQSIRDLQIDIYFSIHVSKKIKSSAENEEFIWKRIKEFVFENFQANDINARNYNEDDVYKDIEIQVDSRSKKSYEFNEKLIKNFELFYNEKNKRDKAMTMLNTSKFKMKILSKKCNKFFEEFLVRFNIYIAFLHLKNKNKIYWLKMSMIFVCNIKQFICLISKSITNLYSMFVKSTFESKTYSTIVR